MDQVEDVKSKVDMVQLVGEYVKLNKAGRNYKGLCPFHGEKTPSFMVNPELQIYKCFGCGEGGDAYQFIQKMEGVEFGEALKMLAKRVGVTLQSYTPTKGEEQRERWYGINQITADYYHYLLTKHEVGKLALEYLTKRGISEQSITSYRLGYAPDGWDFLIKYLVSKKGYKVEDLEKAGLVVPSQKGGYDRFRNRVMFPLTNHRGQVVGFAGRVMPGADEKAGGKYVNTPETEIYHKGDLLYGLDQNKVEIKNAGWVVIVEGEVDSIASVQAGIKNVVAIKGSALTARQVEILKRYTDTLVLALDADLAGDAAARRGIEIAQKAGMIIKVVESGSLAVNPNKYKDPGEWAMADALGWGAAVAAAVPIYDFYIESAIERYGLDVVGKMRVSKEILPLLFRIDDEITKGHYIKKLAKVLDAAEDDVRKQMGKLSFGKSEEVLDGQGGAKTGPKTRREVKEEYVVGLALRSDLTEKLLAPEVVNLFESGIWKRIVDEVGKHYQPGMKVRDLIDRFPAEIRQKAEEIVLAVGESIKEGDLEKEWETAVRLLEEAVLREKIANLRGREGKEAEVAKLVVRLNELTRVD